MKIILKSSDPIAQFTLTGGGKARNMAHLTQWGYPVPPWFCVSSEALQLFTRENNLSQWLIANGDWNRFETLVEEKFLASALPRKLEEEIRQALIHSELNDCFVSVRSSGIDEDSAENSFAGQFSSFLFQKGFDAISESLKRCWASGFSARAMQYRQERGLALDQIQIGVVIQLMVNAESSGVAFSRNPIKPLERESLLISSVWGLGEGLVSGELDSDNFEVHRSNQSVTSQIASKTHAMRQAEQGGLLKADLEEEKKEVSSLLPNQVLEVAKLALSLEKHFGNPQDIEWAIEKNRLYVVQARPVTSLPKEGFFDAQVNGNMSILWDNSNIIESYSGVTSPLTFTFANYAYRQVYIQFCEIVGVPRKSIADNEPMFRNMLGLLRGRIYYNLINWYRLVLLLPGASNNKSFMETMMGVKQKLKPESAKLFDELGTPITYPLPKRIVIGWMTFYRYLRIDSIVQDFHGNFNKIYEEIRKLKFSEMSLTDLSKLYQRLDNEILREWYAPIINDYLCMIFFGLLKKLTEKWTPQNQAMASLQNDLLCGQGELESTEPTKMLMRIAEKIDQGDRSFREWMLTAPPAENLARLSKQVGDVDCFS